MKRSRWRSPHLDADAARCADWRSCSGGLWFFTSPTISLRCNSSTGAFFGLPAGHRSTGQVSLSVNGIAAVRYAFAPSRVEVSLVTTGFGVSGDNRSGRKSNEPVGSATDYVRAMFVADFRATQRAVPRVWTHHPSFSQNVDDDTPSGCLDPR